ncbi:hypothetical protein LRS10_17425 [Phenylobacterium sp. J426]|uniref:hypothetical protein n=1 Tax=Phenylobacterium sp. J426 TaxID=2898439 RepID=UPI002151EA18|nr:hypothetical protein [Phenylobacterium sp. J426]MCR5875789.1 hypothetical protein [Phenylobacterium sp. J426]
MIAAVVFAIAAPASQAYFDVGLSASEFADQGNSTLRAAGYAFSIWSLIYLGLAAYAIWQALPRNTGNAAIRALAWPSVFTIAATGAWIYASAFNARWLTVAIIAAAAAVMIFGLMRASRGKSAFLDWLLVWWPLGLLAGWLTVASAVNILTIMTAEGLIAPDPAVLYGAAGVLITTGVALWVLRRTAVLPYGAAVAWGLVAVWVAERPDNPIAAWLALACAIAVGLAAAWWGRPATSGRR